MNARPNPQAWQIISALGAILACTVASTKGVGRIEFTTVPNFGSEDDLDGRVYDVETDNHRVAVYIYVGGWYPKPTDDKPLTVIQDDNTWTCDITVPDTNDAYATKIAAFLVPNEYNPPLADGQPCLASELYQYPYAEAIRYKTISFSGYDWWVKRANDPVHPGLNYFSDSVENVWVDPNGHLHLSIAQRDENWYCSEVITHASFGYGTYAFTVAGRVDLLDENVVLGLFTWEDCVPEHNYREIDVELSSCAAFRKTPDDANNAQFVVQPWNTHGNLYRFQLDLEERPGQVTSYQFSWRPDGIDFTSYFGGYSPQVAPQDTIGSWPYRGDDIPPAGAENARITFYLAARPGAPEGTLGSPPTDGQDAEIIIREFRFLRWSDKMHDWNNDGIVSIVGDVPPFVDCVYFSDCPPGLDTITVGDCSGDDIVSIVGDVPCFVDCVYFGNCPE
jgi:hypothetical protein